MLSFHSSSARVINSRKAVQECIEILGGDRGFDCDLLMLHASVGHNFADLLSEARRLCPSATIVGSSCCGVIGREGVSETMKDLALMAIRGPEVAAVHVDGVFGGNCREKTRQLAADLKARLPETNMVYFLGSGIDTANDLAIAAIEEVFGPDVSIFGATSADNMRGVASYQLFNDGIFEHSAWLVGFAEKGLKVATGASHGFVAVGEPMVVTKADGHRIIELDGVPAWSRYASRLDLTADSDCGQTIPVGALAEELPPDLASEYGNSHILRVVTSREPEGAMHYATTITAGTRLWLTVRDEDRIFSDMDRMTSSLRKIAGGAETVAVFHADCLARGRHLFNRILKEELVSRMQAPFLVDGAVPPWLGMYGFGEFARLGGRNQYHNYTSAVYALFRDGRMS